ncbi:hypothetical protein [Paraburkholderia tropica]|uniref:hypothetical protein n=1 Tax=Paraburkholderia tropica TaxID=92647 RepID=UPI002AB67996|nr:hypothetical protein [Paraburkholderia tropica]
MTNFEGNAMNSFQYATSAVLLAGLCHSAGVLAQGTGSSPYGSELGQHTTAPGSKGDQERRAKLQKNTAKSNGHASRRSASAVEASAPRAHPSDDTGAK